MNKKDYNDFFQFYSDKLPIFVSPWYLDAVCLDGIWGASIIKDGGRVIAAMPYFFKRKYGFRYITMPHFTKYMGPFFSDGYSPLDKQELLEDMISQFPKFDAFIQNFHYSITDWLPFYWRKFEQTTRYSYCLDVSNLDKVYEGINRNMKRNIKKAQATLAVTIENLPELFYDINALSFNRQGLSIPYTRIQFLLHDKALANRQARAIFFARDKKTGTVHSAAYIIWDKQSSYYHLSGDDPVLRQSGSGILLIWEAIRYTNEKLGLNTFDFEGSMIANVEAIRRQFGSVQTPYFTISKHNSALLEFLKRWR